MGSSILNKAGDKGLQLWKLGLEILAISGDDLQLSFVLFQTSTLLLSLILIDCDVLAHCLSFLLKLNYDVFLRKRKSTFEYNQSLISTVKAAQCDHLGPDQKRSYWHEPNDIKNRCCLLSNIIKQILWKVIMSSGFHCTVSGSNKFNVLIQLRIKTFTLWAS